MGKLSIFLVQIGQVYLLSNTPQSGNRSSKRAVFGEISNDVDKYFYIMPYLL